MPDNEHEPRSHLPNAQAAFFGTTHWSVVLTAGLGPSPQADTALASLCETYWYPLYGYIRRQGKGPEDAEDLTQQFFVKLLAGNYLARADRERGKFRTFLLASVKNFLVNEWKRESRLKRGGAHSFMSFDLEQAEERYSAEPIAFGDPENVYDKQWGVALIEQVFVALRLEYAGTGKGPLLDELKPFVWGEESPASYREIGLKLNVAEGTVRVGVHRLRQRFRELLRTTVAQTVSRSDEIDDELRHLIAVLG